MSCRKDKWSNLWWLSLSLLTLLLSCVHGHTRKDYSGEVVSKKLVTEHIVPLEKSDDAKFTEIELKDDESENRLFIIDGGTTDNIGIADFFIYFGAGALALVCITALIGLVLALLDQIQSTPSGGGGYGPPVDTYSSYQRIFDVTSALDKGQNMYEDPTFDHQMMMSMASH